MVDWQGRCNGVAWIYNILAGKNCNSLAWIYDGLTPQSIKHRFLAYHHTKLGRYSTMQIYPLQIDPPLLQLSINLWKTSTPHMLHIHIAQCTYTHCRLTPPLHLSIDLWKTIAPNTFHIYVTVSRCTGTLDGLVGSHTRLAIYPTLTICC